MKLVRAIIDGPEVLYRYLNSGNVEELSSHADSFNEGNVEPQAKRFRGDDHENSHDRDNSNDSGSNIPSLLNISTNPPGNNEASQNNGNFNSNNGNNSQKPRTREGRRQGSRWSSRR